MEQNAPVFSSEESFFIKRVSELDTIFTAFKSFYEDVEYENESAHRVVKVYFEFLDFFKNYLEPDAKANIYKIVSGTELAILRTLPVAHENPQIAVERSARLAFFAGQTILYGWFKDLKDKDLSSLDSDLAAFSEEHLLWLELLNPEAQYPYLSNAQTWRLFHLLLQRS